MDIRDLLDFDRARDRDLDYIPFRHGVTKVLAGTFVARCRTKSDKISFKGFQSMNYILVYNIRKPLARIKLDWDVFSNLSVKRETEQYSTQTLCPRTPV